MKEREGKENISLSRNRLLLLLLDRSTSRGSLPLLGFGENTHLGGIPAVFFEVFAELWAEDGVSGDQYRDKMLRSEVEGAGKRGEGLVCGEG